jgi:TPR repeat protein
VKEMFSPICLYMIALFYSTDIHASENKKRVREVTSDEMPATKKMRPLEIIIVEDDTQISGGLKSGTNNFTAGQELSQELLTARPESTIEALKSIPSASSDPKEDDQFWIQPWQDSPKFSRADKPSLGDEYETMLCKAKSSADQLRILEEIALKQSLEKFPIACIWIADLYFDCASTLHDYEKARKYYRKAAKQQDDIPSRIYAWQRLAEIYQEGYGVDRDEQTAQAFKNGAQRFHEYVEKAEFSLDHS